MPLHSPAAIAARLDYQAAHDSLFGSRATAIERYDRHGVIVLQLEVIDADPLLMQGYTELLSNEAQRKLNTGPTAVYATYETDTETETLSPRELRSAHRQCVDIMISKVQLEVPLLTHERILRRVCQGWKHYTMANRISRSAVLLLCSQNNDHGSMVLVKKMQEDIQHQDTQWCLPRYDDAMDTHAPASICHRRRRSHGTRSQR